MSGVEVGAIAGGLVTLSLVLSEVIKYLVQAFAQRRNGHSSSNGTSNGKMSPQQLEDLHLHCKSFDEQRVEQRLQWQYLRESLKDMVSFQKDTSEQIRELTQTQEKLTNYLEALLRRP